MAQGKARTPKSFGRRIKDQQVDIKKLYNLVERRNAVAQVSSQLGGQAPNTQSTGFLKTAGDTMIGPIAFLPVLITLGATDTIDIGKETDAFTSRIILSNAGANDLATISGAQHNGQLLFIQGVQTETIPITTVGNIETIDGSTFTLADDDIIMFMFDVTDNKWQQVTIGKNSAGGVAFPIEPVITDNSDTWTGTQTLNLATGNGHVYKWIMDQALTFAATVTNRPSSGTQRTFELEFEHDGTGGTFTVTLPSNFKDEKGTTLASLDVKLDKTVILTCRINNGTDFLVVQKNVTATAAAVEIVTWTADHSAATFDLTSLDRLRFSLDSGAPTASSDPSIFLKTDKMVFNLPTADEFQFNINDVAAFFGGNKVGGTADAFFQVHGVDTVIPNLEVRNEKATPATGRIGNLNFQSENASNEDILYAQI